MKLLLDLFCGLGGASAAFRATGWEVVGVDAVPPAEIVADIATWSWDGRRPDFVWASPPCTEFSRDHLPWLRGKFPPPSLDLVRAAIRVIGECKPLWWCLENVRGSVRWIRPLLGDPIQVGQAFLWGRFPHPGRVAVEPHKQRLSSSRRRERSMIPWEISAAMCAATLAPTLFDAEGDR